MNEGIEPPASGGGGASVDVVATFSEASRANQQFEFEQDRENSSK